MKLTGRYCVFSHTYLSSVPFAGRNAYIERKYEESVPCDSHCCPYGFLVLMASCSTTGGNVFTAKDRTESLIEALSATPITVEKEEPVLPSPEPVTPVTNAPKSEKPEVVEIQEPEPSETESITEEAPVIPAVSEEEDEAEVPTAVPGCSRNCGRGRCIYF